MTDNTTVHDDQQMLETKIPEGARQCEGRTRTGGRCRGRALPEDVYCWAHSPQLAEQRAAWSRAGGHGRSNMARAAKRAAAQGPQGVSDLMPILLATISEVRTGTVSPAVAAAVASLCRASVNVAGAVDVETRLAELESKLGVSA